MRPVRYDAAAGPDNSIAGPRGEFGWLPMKPALVATALLAAVAACRGDPIRRIAAPAPTGALECSRRVLEELGYAATGGYLESGYLYFERPPGTLLADVLTVEESGGELRVFAASRNHRNRHAPPTEESLGHVRAVFARCAAR